MVGSVNKVILLGNLGRDPEIRSMQSGSKMANFSIATSKRWKDRNTQEQKEKTSWHNIVIFGDGLVDIVEKYVKKGSKVYVEGELQTRKWQDQSGQDRYTTEVVVQGFNGVMQMLGGRAQGGAPAQGGMGGQQQQGGWGQPQQPQQQQQYSAPAQQQAPQQQAPQQAQPQYNEPPMDFDDDIPF